MVSPSEKTTSTPIAVLIDELKSEDVKRKVNSVKNLMAIANALGAERTKTELIPFLVNEMLEDEDEVLLGLSETLPNLCEVIGSGNLLLPAVEKLCYAEDITVRDKAIAGFKRVLAKVDIKKSEENIMGIIKRFVSADYHTAKGAAASIIPTVYPMVSSNSQSDLLQIYALLSTDEVPLVRKFAAMNLKDFVKLLPNTSETDLFNILKTFLKDEQDFVRLYVIDGLVAFAKAYNGNAQKLNTAIIPILKTLAEDATWRTRYTVSDKVVELGQFLGKELNKKYLLPYFIKFLGDSEAEIKTNAAARLADYAILLDVDDIVGKVIPAIKPLASDTIQHVRSALASSILQLCPLIGKKYTNEHILSLFLLLLRDEFSDVRLALFKNLDEITKVIDIDSLSQSLLPALTDLAVDKNWRTRAASIEFLSFFARKMGEGFLNDKFSKILLEWLHDRVFGVREAAVNCIKSLTEILGGTWAEKVLFPKIAVLQNNANYLHRQTILFIIIKLAGLLGQDALGKTVVPVLQVLYKDPVPNVRINAAKALKTVNPYLKEKSTEKENVKKWLTALQEDSDVEVKLVAKSP
eukprot:CAMPEP_0176453318 /NCGR_PEP_ID=MMETSP0127-20121128/29152_1 /TAXON_ID=938130 /ORGANISM="Platyophrya macrostoma, Strain WH" /LENGTH=578 /DNA_ID=CAMNT_0017842125 /DNA_START=154 /DNA_END=1890 /DNA_ORIENTATION=+